MTSERFQLIKDLAPNLKRLGELAWDNSTTDAERDEINTLSGMILDRLENKSPPVAN